MLIFQDSTIFVFFPGGVLHSLTYFTPVLFFISMGEYKYNRLKPSNTEGLGKIRNIIFLCKFFKVLEAIIFNKIYNHYYT